MEKVVGVTFSLANVTPERIGRWLTGVARKDPETVRKELFSATYSLWASAPDQCTGLGGGEDQSQGGDVEGLRCGSPGGSGKEAYQGDRDVVFADIFSRCYRKVRARSNFILRNVGVASNCSVLPSTMTLSSPLPLGC